MFFVNKYVNKLFDKSFVKGKKQQQDPNKKEVFLSLEFLGKTFLQVKKQLLCIFRTRHKNVKLNVAFNSSKNKE